MPLTQEQIDAVRTTFFGEDGDAPYPGSVEGCVRTVIELRERLRGFADFHELVPDAAAIQVLADAKVKALAAANEMVTLLT